MTIIRDNLFQDKCSLSIGLPFLGLHKKKFSSGKEILNKNNISETLLITIFVGYSKYLI